MAHRIRAHGDYKLGGGFVDPFRGDAPSVKDFYDYYKTNARLSSRSSSQTAQEVMAVILYQSADSEIHQ
jgi:hypothetical protein